ncbi:MAG: DNA gyrase subunit A [Planctomycetaceae bacterium]|jgi:DNA gyrase subunit A|nr:DNA gyrase subunit A [Phycisphaerales bacterium]MCE2654581.1 DNA gyrase subunit A [Planctomycetaceae bacterium]
MGNNEQGSAGAGNAEGQTGGTAGGPGAIGHVVDLKIERELQDSYLTYAMSTIMDRALPDVRDGLKPSQRRILVAMNDLRLQPGRKHRKCAKICGDTSGNYHPHGESVIYPTLVIMGQSWRMRTPLVDPQGNFGSIKPDPPAAMRYTEARMTVAASEMLADLDLGTVDHQANFDSTREEPLVLPGKFPNLLVNGAVGIAVGMATSMAPNNPVEVLDSIIRVIENPEIPLLELMQDVTDAQGKVVRRGIKGPDFPTGGMILGRRGIVEGYETGRGKIIMRGRVAVEAAPGSKDRQQLVVYELPFASSINTLVEQLGTAVEAENIKDISAVYDESNAKSPVRVVIELKKGADPGIVEKQLYEYTGLQQSFSIQNIALVNRQPRTLSLKELIRCYIDHRAEVIRRRTAHLLSEARRQAHLLEGMILAVCDLDEVIKLIRSSRTRAEAIEALLARRFSIAGTHAFAKAIPERLMTMVRAADGQGGVLLSRLQAEAIGSMRLIQLVGLEIEKLVADYAQLASQIADYEDILARHARVLAIITADCEEMKKRFGGERITEIQDSGEESFNIASLIPVHDVAVTISHQGYAKRVPLETYRRQGRGGKGIIASTSKDDDYTEHMLVCSSHDDLLVFTDTGRVFKIKVFELPELDRTSKGRPIVNLVELKAGEKARGFLAVKNFEAGSQVLTFVSANGLVKRTALKAYMNVHKGGLNAVDIREGDSLLDVILTSGTDDLLLVTASGMAIRFPEDDAREMGRVAGGVRGIDLAEGDQIIGAVGVPMREDGKPDDQDEDARKFYRETVEPGLHLLTITENGYGKRTLIDEYRVQPETGKMRSQSRGGKGRQDIGGTDGRNGRSVAALLVRPGDDLVVVTKDGQLVRMPVEDIRETGRGAQGVRVASLNEGDKVVAASRVAGNEGA